MKKLFFLLLLALVGIGLVTAGPIHPPGEISPGLTGYGVHEAAITPATVLVLVQPSQAQPTSFLAFPDRMRYFTGQMQGYHIIKPIGYSLGPDYWLRL